MLERLLRNGAQSYAPTSGVCWRCLLDRQLASSVQRRTSFRTYSDSKKKSESDQEAGEDKKKTSASSKPSSSAKPPKQSAKPTGAEAKDDTNPAESQVKTPKAKKPRTRSKKISKHTNKLKIVKHSSDAPVKIRNIKGEGDVSGKAADWSEMRGDKKDGGRSRLRRHLMRVKKSSATGVAEDGQDGSGGESMQSAMGGHSLESGGHKESEKFAAGDLAIDGASTIHACLGRSTADTQHQSSIENLVQYLDWRTAYNERSSSMSHYSPHLCHQLMMGFSRGVLQLRDLHSRVYNFDPALEMLPPVDQVDFKSLTQFTPPSKDITLAQIARDTQKKFIGSTSSLTGMLKHFHFLLSAHRPLNFKMLSHLNKNPESMSKITKAPDVVFLKYRDGVYSVDADKEYDKPNVLSLMGRYLEKYFTSDAETFNKYKIGNRHMLSEDDAEPDAFHYSTIDDFLMRSQLDAYDPRLPGTGIFDLKTRAVLPIRMDNTDFEWGMDYEINQREGELSSFEREFADMARATMLKYSLQARIGRMDGIFVAYHNIARIFGFQYISINEMDYTLHGQEDRCLGDQEFLSSMHLLNKLFNKAVERFPKQSLRLHVETPDTKELNTTLHFYAEPVTDDQIEKIQTANKGKVAEWEEEILGLGKDPEAPYLDPEAQDSESFTTLTSDTDKFRARARKIQDNKLAAKGRKEGHAQTVASPEDSETSATQQAEGATASDEVVDQAIAAATDEHQWSFDDPGDTAANAVNEATPSSPEPSPSTPEAAVAGAPASSTDEAPIETDTPSPLETPLQEPNLVASAENAIQATEPDSSSPTDTAETSTTTRTAAHQTTFQSSLAAAANPFAIEKEKEKLTKPKNSKKPSSSSSSKTPPTPDLLTLTLRTTHHINSKRQARPTNLHPTDAWHITPTISEITNSTLSHKMYEAVKRRRKALMEDKSEERALEELSGKGNFFKDTLRRATREGKGWRVGRDVEDRGRESRDGGVWVWDRESVVKRGEYSSKG